MTELADAGTGGFMLGMLKTLSANTHSGLFCKRHTPYYSGTTDVIYAPQIKQVEIGVEPYNTIINVAYPVASEITITKTDCPYNSDVFPQPRACQMLMPSFKGFLILASQGSFDVTDTPDARIMNCTDSDMGPDTVGVTHTTAMERTSLSVKYFGAVAGSVQFRAYIVVSREDSQRGQWFELIKWKIVFDYVEPPPPPISNALSAAVETERAAALKDYIAVCIPYFDPYILIIHFVCRREVWRLHQGNLVTP